MQQPTLLWITAIALLLGSLFVTASEDDGPDPASAAPRVEPVNAVIGDESYLATFGELPTTATAEDVRLRTHLAYVEGLLRARDVSHLTPRQRMNRALQLDRLHDYWQAGVFPRNTQRPGRSPVFIDEEGRLCAVGHLVAASEGRAAAETIDADYRYALIEDITRPMLDAWALHNGFTRRELAMIQPSYCHFDPNHPLCPGPRDPQPADESLPAGVEVAAMGVNASAALVNGYLAGTGRSSRWVAGAGLLTGGFGLAVGLSERADYRAGDLALAGASILASGWSLLAPSGEAETPVASRQSALQVQPSLVRTGEGHRPGVHVHWRF